MFVDDEVLDGIHAVDLAGGVSLAIVTAIAVRSRDGEGSGHEWTVIGSDTLWRAADAHGAIRRPMVRGPAGKDLVALRLPAPRMVLTRGFEARCHALRAATAQPRRGQVPPYQA